MHFAFKIVLKRWFGYYSGMVRPTYQETIATEKTVCHSQIPRKGGMPYHSGQQREAPAWVRRQRKRKIMWAKDFIAVPQERKGKIGQRDSELDSLNNFSRF